MTTEEMMKDKLDEFSYRRWLALYQQQQKLDREYDVHRKKGVELANKSRKMIRKWSAFWGNDKEKKNG